jgi:hypothetical protein
MGVTARSPDLAMRFFEGLTQSLASSDFTQWNAEQISRVISLCREAQRLTRSARRSVQLRLNKGVEAKEFVKRFSELHIILSDCLSRISRIVEKGRDWALPTLAEGWIKEWQAVGREMAALNHLLNEALAKATPTQMPLDWERIHEVEAAYARGETRPFQKSATDEEA